MAIDRQATVRRAENLAQAGKVDQAIAEYTSVLEAYPDDWSIANTLGDLHARAGRPDRAADIFSSIGDAFLSQGFFPKAVAHYKKTLKARPGDDHALSSLAKAAVQQELYADARLYLGQLLQQRRARGNAAGVADCEARLEAIPDPRAMARRSAASAPAAPAPSGSPPGAPDVPRAGPTGHTGGVSRSPAPAPGAAASVNAAEPEHAEPGPAHDAAGDAAGDEADDAFVLDAGSDAEGSGAAPARYEIEVFGQRAPAQAPAPPAPPDRVEAAPEPAARVDRPPATPPPDADLFEDDGEVVDLDQWLDAAAESPPDAVAAPTTPEGPVSSTTGAGESPREDAAVDASPPAAPSPGIPADEPIERRPADDPRPGGRGDVSVETAVESPAASAASSAVFAASADETLDDVRTLAAELEAAAASPSLRFQAAAQLGRLWMQQGDLERAVTWLTRAAEATSPVREQRLAVQYELADALERVGRTSEALHLLRDIELDAGGFRDVRTRIARLEAIEAAGPHS